jgi:signal transduction histidine kinase
MGRLTYTPSPRLAVILAAALAFSVAVLGWLGYRAIREWQLSATLFAGRRAQEAADLLATTLTRDMRAVQVSVLSSNDWVETMLEPPYDVTQLVASAFARYPYPESFFARRGAGESGSVVFFARADRVPRWVTAAEGHDTFPVLVASEPRVGRALFERITSHARQQHRFSIFDISLDDRTYQVVARLQYRDPFRLQLASVFGFMVDLDWAKRHYLQDFASEVQRVAGADSAVVLTISKGATDAAADLADPNLVRGRRPFSLAFFDPLSLALNAPPDYAGETWTAEASLAADALAAATRGARRTLWITAVAGAVFVIGLGLAVHGVRVNANLVRRRADFVSAVTHELKTPVATIRAAGETVLSGRLTDQDASREYARLVVEHAKRLARLLDNVLAYARITDVTDGYTFEPVPLGDLVEETLRDFRWLLDSGGFDVDVDVPRDLPRIRGDRTALELLLGNLVDNAIRYSRDTRRIRVSARSMGGLILLEVADRGMGIPPDELAHVTRRFFRGRRAGSGGSGLGLAIADRIVTDHRGQLSIESLVGQGTTVRITLPASASAL